jgi:NAD(P)-dependent dehydrogenase (short-subunit alcohol dehydrogenase family)
MSGYLESLFSLKGQVAVVTGGGRGLGKGMAIALAGAGADVALISRTADELHATVREIRQAGGRADAYPGDAFKLEEMTGLIQSVHSAKGRVDILVNNAGFAVRKPALEFTPEDWERQVDVNLKAAYFIAQATGRIMKAQGRGKIINIASLTSYIGLQNGSVYGITRGGILSMTRSLAIEWAGDRINVNAIAPGYFHTRQTAPVFADEKRREWIMSRIPLGRSGVAEDLAGAAVFLASRASDYITGQIVIVDGGWLAG